jgi:hypothetical protein
VALRPMMAEAEDDEGTLWPRSKALTPMSGAGRKRLFVASGHSARCISIHRCYKVLGPARGHTRLQQRSKALTRMHSWTKLPAITF